MVTISTGSFVGKFEVSINVFTTPKLQQYIDRYSTKYLYDMLGEELFLLWNAGAGTPIYDKLTNPFIFQSRCGKVYESKGIEDMLLGLIYWHYVTDITTKQSINGGIKNSNENSKDASFVLANVHDRYYESLLTYRAIQAWVIDNSIDYPLFNGNCIDMVIPYF